MRIHRASVILFVALLLAVALGACGITPTPTVEPIDIGKYFTEGNELARAGEFEKAIAAYKTVLEADPENVSALTNLGVAYYSTGNLEDAIASYMEALEISAQDADIRSNLAAAYVQTGQFEEALEQYEKAIELKPELAEAHFGLGVVYTQLGDTLSAIEAFLKFQALDTGSDQIATDQAQQYLDQLRGQ